MRIVLASWVARISKAKSGAGVSFWVRAELRLDVVNGS
jgi:hypothetical protein